MTRTNTPDLHPRSSTSPRTTSQITPEFPEFLAISSRFRLLSRPIVHNLPGWPRGRGRYFPFPVPESRPTEPVGKLDRNWATIGHGYSVVGVSRRYLQHSYW